MATVRITDKLISHVKQSLTNLFAGKLDNLQSQIAATLKGDEIYAALVSPELRTQLAALPQDFLHKAHELRVNVNKQIIVLKMSMRRPIKAAWVVYEGLPIDATFPQVQTVIDLQAEHARVTAERDTLITRVVQILNECATLAQVCEVWPTVLEHIPKEAYERHITRKEKAAPIKPVLDGLMDDEFKGSLAKATLLARARQAA